MRANDVKEIKKLTFILGQNGNVYIFVMLDQAFFSHGSQKRTKKQDELETMFFSQLIQEQKVFFCFLNIYLLNP